jgi:hypothetical protein
MCWKDTTLRLDIVNNTSYPDVPIKEMYNGIGKQLYHLAKAWKGASYVVKDLNKQGFYLSLEDELDIPDALGYHDVDEQGNPYSKIGVKPSLENGSDWLTGQYSVVSVVGHEALETVCNPIINIWRDIDQDRETVQEVCDAVEDTGYQYKGMDLTNFLYPSWFNPFGKAPFDYLGQLTAPFTMTAGGYMIIRSGGQYNQVFGTEYKEWRKSLHYRTRQLG